LKRTFTWEKQETGTLVEYCDWEPYYHRILKAFQYDRSEDETSALLLDTLLSRHRLRPEHIHDMIYGMSVYILGAHERIEEDLNDMIDRNIAGIFIAADGASSAMREAGLRPDLILTDLDGKEEDLLYWNRKGVPLIVHAHGDNSERIRHIAPRITHSLATTQARPFGNVFNFGGFTDGDRCVFLADHFAAKEIILCGFDYSAVGKYSFSTDPETKLRKLKWAKQLISEFEVEYY
jgi:2-amino-4-hydroxy-6-hydroxymethyldihydropteridine diphosphokinase